MANKLTFDISQPLTFALTRKIDSLPDLKTFRPEPPPIDPVDLPYIFETDNLNGYELTFTSETGAGFVRVAAIKSTNGASNISATLDGVPWFPVAIAEEAVQNGVVVAIFAAKGEDVGEHTVVFGGSVGKGAGRFGDVLTYDSIKQAVEDVIPQQYYWENAIGSVLPISDITMIAASSNAVASPISGDGIQQGQSFVEGAGVPLAAWFSHSPPPNASFDYYVVYPAAPAIGVMASVEVTNLKPIFPDLQKVIPVQNASFTKLANGNYHCVIYAGSSIRFLWPLGQLKGAQEYTLSFEVISRTGNGTVTADWNDGTDSGDLTTLPAGPVSMSAIGAKSFIVKRASYTETYRFLDIENSDDPDEEGETQVIIVITPPILEAKLN